MSNQGSRVGLPAWAPLINPKSVRQAILGAVELETDERDRTPEGVKGAVIRVYPIGHPKNGLHQLLADVLISRDLPVLHKVPVMSAHAHQETPIAATDTRFRNPYAPKSRNQIEGVTYDIRPGTLVWVHFENRDFREPIIVGTVKFNYQGDKGFPIDKHVVFEPAHGGKTFSSRERLPLDSGMDEYPRAVESYNGSRREIDNKGNVLEQASIDRDPVFPGDNMVPASPLPEGSRVQSTRGAHKGNIGRLTGLHPVTGETNAEGVIYDETHQAGIGDHTRQSTENQSGRIENYSKSNGDGSHADLASGDGVGRMSRKTVGCGDGTVRDETASAVGDIVHRASSGSGRMWGSTAGSGDGRVYYEDNGADYLSLDGAEGTAEFHGELRAVLDSAKVLLGSKNADHGVTLWDLLFAALEEIFTLIDTHIHGGVQSGGSVTDPPNVQAAPIWAGKDCGSHVAYALKEADPQPTFQGDPGGEGI